MSVVSAALRRHGAVYMADRYYRMAWLAWPLAIAVFCVSRMLSPGAPNDDVASSDASTPKPSLAPSQQPRRSLSNIELYRQAKAHDPAAENIIRRAANEGSAVAQNMMGSLYDPRLNKEGGDANRLLEAIDWYSRAAKQGAPIAERNLGLLLSATFFDVQPNYSEARTWLSKVAPIELAAARQLGYLEIKGEGGPVDVEAGVRLLRMAADRGDLYSETTLGTLYEAGGHAGPAKMEDAARMFRLAALQGDVTSERKLASHLEKGDGIQADKAKAKFWYARAAAGGDATAQHKMAQLDPAAEFRRPKWGVGEPSIDVSESADVEAERERCVAGRSHSPDSYAAADLATSFAEQKKQAASLVASNPRDARVRYARASALYDDDRADLARVQLECAIDDPATQSKYRDTQPYLYALLARIDVEQGNRSDAEKTIAPVCLSKMESIRGLDKDIGLCP